MHLAAGLSAEVFAILISCIAFLAAFHSSDRSSSSHVVVKYFAARLNVVVMLQLFSFHIDKPDLLSSAARKALASHQSISIPFKVHHVASPDPETLHAA